MVGSKDPNAIQPIVLDILPPVVKVPASIAILIGILLRKGQNGRQFEINNTPQRDHLPIHVKASSRFGFNSRRITTRRPTPLQSVEARLFSSWRKMNRQLHLTFSCPHTFNE